MVLYGKTANINVKNTVNIQALESHTSKTTNIGTVNLARRRCDDVLYN